jgi:RHS repeat-associated protein
MTRPEAEPEAGNDTPRAVVSGVTLYNARLKPGRSLNPFFTARTGTLEELLAFEDVAASGWEGRFHEGGNTVPLDLSSAHQSTFDYDATLRVIRTKHPDGTFGRTEYEPLVTRSFDEHDTDPASPYFETPMVNFADGLGRLIEVNEVVRLNDDGTTSGALSAWITRYDYDLNDRLTRITDSQNNVKELRYDGLQRKVWMNDPDAGLSTNVYDAASNLLETTDAKGQRITYTYDGVNRLLTEDYHDEASPEFSYGRTPDVAYHYDVAPLSVDQGDGTIAAASNVKGLLAWVADNSGEEHTSYDARGRVAWTAKRVMDPVLSPTLTPEHATLVSYKTAFSYDPMDRITRMVYPDNDEVSYRYNARSLLLGITGGPSGHILTGIDYLPSAQPHKLDYGNGVRTTYAYDPRQRLTTLRTHHASRTTEPLIHFAYDLDPVSNIRAITDLRPTSTVPADSPRRNTQHFEYDDLYRLTRVQYNRPNPAPANGGEINYRYDRIGNLLEQTSDLKHVERGVPVTDLGTLNYGGGAGRFDRIGRQPNDPPGPHALSQISTPNSQLRDFPYDANGNMTEIDGLQCTWDFRDRLVAVEDDTMRAEYRYDFTGRRIIKRIVPKPSAPSAQTPSARTDPPTAVIYPGKHFEVRDHDQPVKYVFNAATRVAKITSSLSTNQRVQRLRLHSGWNLCSIAVAGASLPTGPAIQTAHLWNPAGGGYSLVAGGQILGAGAVVWIKAAGNVVISLTGQAVEPSTINVPAGPSFLAGPGLQVWPLDLPAMLTAWHYDTVAKWWQSGIAGDLAALTDLPRTLTPGEAIFIRTDAPVELGIPDPGWRILYYHQDHLTSSSVVTDRAGNLVEESANHPFGSPRNVHALADIETHYSFGQKERDRESALHYFEARYLASTVSRFASVDPKYLNPDLLSEKELTSLLSRPQNINLYAYVANNPLTYVDPTGLDPMKHVENAGQGNDLIGAFAGGVEMFAKEGGKWMKAAKVAGPVTAVIGVGVKTAKFANDPNADTASELSWEVSKAAIGTLNPVAGVAIYVGEQLGLDIGKGLNWAGHKIGSAMAGPTPLEAMQEWKREQRYIQRTKAVHRLQRMITATKQGNESAQEVATFLEGVGQTEDARGLRAEISRGQEEIKNYEQQIQNIYRSK